MQKAVETVWKGCTWLASKWWSTCKWPWNMTHFEMGFFFVGSQVIVLLSLLPLVAYSMIRSLPLLPQLSVWILLGLVATTAWEMYTHKSRGRSTAVSEVELLEKSLKEKDQADPNWDRDARVAACSAGLEDGTEVALLRKVYGDEIVDEVLSGAKAPAEAAIDPQGEKK